MPQLQHIEPLMFDLISGYIGRVEDVIIFAQLCHGSFQSVYEIKRLRNHILQEHLSKLVTSVMKNEYQYMKLHHHHSQLVDASQPTVRLCKYRFTKGPLRHHLCKKQFSHNHEEMCEAHRQTNKPPNCTQINNRTQIKQVKRQMSNIIDTFDDLDHRIDAIRSVRARLSKTCFNQ